MVLRDVCRPCMLLDCGLLLGNVLNSGCLIRFVCADTAVDRHELEVLMTAQWLLVVSRRIGLGRD